MATCSSIPAWKILWTEEPGGLQSMGSKESTQLSEKAQRQIPLYLFDSSAKSMYSWLYSIGMQRLKAESTVFYVYLKILLHESLCHPPYDIKLSLTYFYEKHLLFTFTEIFSSQKWFPE